MKSERQKRTQETQVKEKTRIKDKKQKARAKGKKRKKTLPESFATLVQKREH